MDNKTFIAEIVKALAWPTSILAVSILLRKQIAALLEGVKLSKLKRGDWEAEFSETTREVRAELSLGVKSDASSPAPEERNVPNRESLLDEFGQILHLSPVTAVEAAWSRIEHGIGFLSGYIGLSTSGFTNDLNGLVQKQVITISTKDSIFGLRQLRNLAVHGPEDSMNEQRAKEFLAIADAIIWTLDSARRKVEKGDSK